MTRRLRLAAQLAGLRRGAHHARARTNAYLVLALTTGGLITLSGLAVFAVFHLIVFKEVAR